MTTKFYFLFHIARVVSHSSLTTFFYSLSCQAQVHPEALSPCNALQFILDQHGGFGCLRGRFDDLPIHQLRYDTHQSNKVNKQEYSQTIQGISDPSLLQ